MDLDSVAHVLESDGRVLGVLAIVRRKPLLLDKTRQGLFYAIADEAAKGLAQRYVHPPVADARFDAEKRRVGTRKVERSRLDALRALAEKTFVGEGQRHDAQLELMARYAESKLAVLILGETGTGKECTARLIHAASPRRKGPFIVHNVGAVSASLFEAEFFGHKKGAFTGATESRLGHVRSAEGGTLFLDEVGEIPPELQKKLLRVVQDGKLTPVGESKEISVDVRVIAATNVDLPQSVVDHEFREDLFFRLSALMIKLLPLRERMGELELFVVHILEACGEEGRGRTLTPAAWEKLRAHKWRGNFRDLQQTIQGALLLAGPSGPIDAEHIVLRVLPEPSHPKKEPVTFDLVVKTLEQCGGSRKRAAEILGVVPRHISRVLAEGR
ncbi:sigma-54-dependent Fis family transcriptional regulator [bacterium]|nr:sigma-54-dependent Fis family transcriptional regulator [bacterium]